MLLALPTVHTKAGCQVHPSNTHVWRRVCDAGPVSMSSWRAGSGRVVLHCPAPPDEEAFDGSTPMSVAAPSDTALLVLTAPGTVYSVAVPTGAVAKVPAMSRGAGTGRAIACCAASRACAVLTGGSDAADGFQRPAVALWDTSKRKPRALVTHKGAAALAAAADAVGVAGQWCAAFSPDGSFLVVSSPVSGARVLVAKTGIEVGLPQQAQQQPAGTGSVGADAIASVAWLAPDQALLLRGDGSAALADLRGVADGSGDANVARLTWLVEAGSVVGALPVSGGTSAAEGGGQRQVAVETIAVVEPVWADATAFAPVRFKRCQDVPVTLLSRPRHCDAHQSTCSCL
jgi:hypothetical protein